MWFSTAETPRLVLDGLAVHETSLRTRRDEWRGFARAWFRALTWWQDNPGAAEARLGELLKLPPAQLQVAGTRLLDRPANERLFQGGDDAEIVAVARRYAEYFHHQGTLSQGLAAETLISRAVVGG